MLEQENLNRYTTMSQGHAINCIMEQRTYIQLELQYLVYSEFLISETRKTNSYFEQRTKSEAS